MAGRERDWDDNAGSPDPETLYTKEFCIGSFCHMSARSPARLPQPRPSQAQPQEPLR